MHRTRTMMAWSAMLAILLAPGAWSEGAPSVSFNVSDAGGGLFDYALFVDNDGGPDPIIGVLVLHGNSVFGLTGASVIGAPASWAFLAPDPGPPLVDSLD